MGDTNNAKIEILKNGPYLVSGNVPISEKIIKPVNNHYEYANGRIFNHSESNALCRCGHSENHPFCDGSHAFSNFNGDETASREDYEKRANTLEGPTLNLKDDGRCALARFCHREKGDVWELTEDSQTGNNKEEAIIGAVECPAGRLEVLDKEGNLIEPEYEPSIEILQDIEEEVSGPIFVKGKIPIISQDGFTYEKRNRVALCRCGKSSNKPFCDGSHVKYK